MYKKIIKNQYAIIVKLADRIANVEFSFINNDIQQLLKYYEENKELNARLKRHIKTSLGLHLLNYLNYSIEAYASICY